MPKIKSLFGLYDGTNYHISKTTTGVVISPDQDYIWIGDQAFDYTNLSPIFDKPNEAFYPLGGTRNVFPVRGSLVSNKSTVYSPYTNGTDSLVNYGENLSEWVNASQLYTMDKADRIDMGGLMTFTDNSGADINAMNFNAGETINGVFMYDGTIHEVADTDVEDTGAYNFQVEEGYTLAAYNAGLPSYISQFAILAVDTTNKTLLLRGAGRKTYYAMRAYATYGTSQRTLQNFRKAELWKASYTTSGDNGSITIGTPTKISLSYGGSAWYMDSNPIFYAGTNNAGEYCFLMSIENNGSIPLDNAGTNHTVIYDAANYTKTNLGQYLFYKYNASTATTTLLADRRGNQGFVGNVALTTNIADAQLNTYTPTHFEPSPIGGESNIYYAYVPCFGPKATTPTLSFLLCVWDKANDTFTMEICSVAMAGIETISDYVTYKQYNDNTNQQMRLNCVLTKSGADYFLSVFYSHTTPETLALNTTATWKKITTFSIDPTDFSSLTYHSSDTFPVLGFAPQNQNNTRLMCLFENEASIYDWTAGGWTKTAYEAGYFTGMTFDDLGRYWATSVSSQDIPAQSNDGNFASGSFKTFEVSVHVISSSLPNLVSCVWQDSGEFVFTGANLSKNLVVNTYDENGDRVAKSVRLEITANHAVFTSNGLTTLTTTTSAAGDTLIPVTISGAGFINISASFQI